MTRRLLNLLTVLPLLLCLAVVALWVRSQVRGTGRLRLNSDADCFLSVDDLITLQWREEDDPSRWRYFAAGHVDRVADVQTWWVVLVLAALPAWRGLHAARRRRKTVEANVGRCAACGYDLTGNVSGTCRSAECRRDARGQISPQKQNRPAVSLPQADDIGDRGRHRP